VGIEVLYGTDLSIGAAFTASPPPRSRAEEWLREHTEDPDADEIGTRINQDRENYFRWQRDLFGWAIIVGRKR
jgi:hypothetical protein